MNKVSHKIIEKLFILAAAICILSLFLIMFFIFFRGTPAIFEIGFGNFVFGTDWKPTGGLFGILPMIVSSLLSTLGAALIGGPIGVLTAVYMVYMAPPKLGCILRIAVDVLASIPSIIFGFFGLMILIPLIDNTIGAGTGGNSLLAVIIILSIMILPTVISITETSLREVKGNFKEASLALGATEITTIFKVLVPAASSGILSAVILGVGRALGEAMAVILISGNAAKLPDSILSPVRTLAANSALEMSYATGLHQDALFGTGVILFIFIFVLNLLFQVFKMRGDKKNG